MVDLLKPPFMRDFPWLCQITRGYIKKNINKAFVQKLEALFIDQFWIPLMEDQLRLCTGMNMHLQTTFRGLPGHLPKITDCSHSCGSKIHKDS